MSSRFYSSPIPRPSGRIYEKAPDRNWTFRRAGHVFTRYGVVLVESGADGRESYTLLRFALNGRQYSYYESRAYSARFLVTLAARVIRTVAEGGAA